MFVFYFPASGQVKNFGICPALFYGRATLLEFMIVAAIFQVSEYLGVLWYFDWD